MARLRTPSPAILQGLAPFLLLAWAALWIPACHSQPQQEKTSFRLGPVEHRLAGGEADVHAVELTAGRHWLVAVEQRGIDVVVEVVAPDGRSLATVNAPTYRAGTESLLLRPEVTGTYRVEVRSRKQAVGSGHYEIRIRELGDTTPEEQQRILAEAAMVAAGRLSFQETAPTRREAVEKYREAFSHWHALGKKRQEAQALSAIAVLSVRLDEPQQALASFRAALELWQALDERALQAIVLTDMGKIHWLLGEPEAAEATLDDALLLQQALENRYGEAIVLNNKCLIINSRYELRNALECYQRAYELLRALGELEYEATLLSNIGGVSHLLGEPAAALEHHRRALALRQSTGDRRGEARSLNKIAMVHNSLGEMQEALVHYGQALEISREVEDRRWEARALNNIGFTYSKLSEPQRALPYLQQALELRRQLGDRSGTAATLSNLGLVHSNLGEAETALSFHLEALALRRDLRDRRGQATALYQMGHIHRALGDPARAREHFDQALALLAEVGDPRKTANARQELGEVLLMESEPQKARESLSQALKLRREVRDRSGEAQTLSALAQALVMLGRDREARDDLEAALEIIESLRTRVGDPNLRAAFLSSQRRAYELYVDLLMRFHAAEPDRGHDRAALEASERSRARALLDLVQEAGADIRQGLDPELRERHTSLLQRLNAKATQQLTLLNKGQLKDQAAGAELELYSVLAELEEVEAEIRRRSPRYDALTQSRPLSWQEIQRLLDPDTLLLEYALGEERSFVWAVTAGSFTTAELRGREEIETAARRVYDQLSTVDADVRARNAEREAAAALSDLVLGPIAERLDRHRLVVVADGALHYIPFGALPVPASAGEPTFGGRSSDNGQETAPSQRLRRTAASENPLLVRHEIVHLPSVSALAAQRRQGERPPATGWVAILADPVFNPWDSRIRKASIPNSTPRTPQPGESLLERSAGGVRDLGYHRLHATEKEAEAIVALAPPGKWLKALGFAASRSLALGEELSPYRIVHFATHGLIDDQKPELSHLVLSLFDEQGEPQDGFLWLRDIYNLELGAELVVLSGCETALGKQIRGEGLVGLNRGFMYAGVPRVVASLWRVQDRVTAELMARFYRSLSEDGMRPAAALREAQLSIRGEREWADPNYWAAFVLQGDWRFSETSARRE
ncbi:MAG: CHAT domain-containing protein [bacterium]|nr:CHAT domain-containing protein [bacterium]